MKRMGVALVCVGLGLSAVNGCSSDAATGSGGGSAKLGEPCNDATKCSEGTCATAGFCTKPCTAHSDCGCAAGTTDEDIVSGGCGLSCTASFCLKVCASYTECGTASCNVTGKGYMACE